MAGFSALKKQARDLNDKAGLTYNGKTLEKKSSGSGGDTVDYSKKMMESKTADEFNHWAGLRTEKLSGMGTTAEANGWDSNATLYEKWKGGGGTQGTRSQGGSVVAEAAATLGAVNNAANYATDLSGGWYRGYNVNGGTPYDIKSQTGINWINSAAAGDTLTGGDNSRWTKNADGTTTIVTSNGQTYTVGGSGGGSPYAGNWVSTDAAGNQTVSPMEAGKPAMPATGNPALTQAAQQAVSGTQGYGYIATGPNGTYGINSPAGIQFIKTATPGQSITGGDGSTWIKNSDGTVTITQNGKTYTVASPTPSVEFPEFSYESPEMDQQTSAQSALANASLDRLRNWGNFSYDAAADPLYQMFAAAYERNGQRAMQDTLGQIAARTGGMASSYAGTAAQQTYDNYMAGLDDKIPELQQLAYSMYNDEYNRAANLYGLENAALQTLANQYNADRSFNYGAYRDTVGDRQWNTAQSYQASRDAVGDRQWGDQFAETQKQNVFQNDMAVRQFEEQVRQFEEQVRQFNQQQALAEYDAAFGRIVQAAQTGGYPSDKDLATVGITRAQFDAWRTTSGIWQSKYH